MSLHLNLRVNRASIEHQQSVNRPSTAPQQRFNRVSTEHQQFRAVHLGLSKDSATAFTHNRSIGHRDWWYRFCHCHYTWNWASTDRQQDANRASMIFTIVWCTTSGLCNVIDQYVKYCLHLLVIQLLSTWLHLNMRVNRAWTECQQSIIDFGQWILYNLSAELWSILIIEALATFIRNLVSVDLVTPTNEFHQSVNRG